jgi:hypothetical protein
MSSNRNLLANKYSSILSIAIHRLFKPSATAPVVFDPAKGSSTTSYSSESNLIKNSGKTAGNLAGWIFIPAFLHLMV